MKTIPKDKKKKQKIKMASKEALQVAVKRWEAKCKGEKEIYTHLNAEFQRITRRNKEAFYAKKQRKTIEWERQDFFKKIRDTKEIFHAKIGTIKDRNGMDLTEVEDIKKCWQEYTEELYKNIFMIQITTIVWSLI